MATAQDRTERMTTQSIRYHVATYAAQAVNYWLELSTPYPDGPVMSVEDQRTLQDIIANAIAAGVLAERGQPPMRIDAPSFTDRL